MKVKVKKVVEVEIKYLKISVPVRYEEEDMPNGFPFRQGEHWEVVIDIKTGKIEDWPAGFEFDLYMKVCDCGSYWLLDANRSVVGSIEQNYVPHGIVPGEYGDYINLLIKKDGTISNFPKRPSVAAFFKVGDE